MQSNGDGVLAFKSPVLVLSWTYNLKDRDMNSRLRSYLQRNSGESDSGTLIKGLRIADDFFFKEEYRHLLERRPLPVKLDVTYSYEVEGHPRKRTVTFELIVSSFREDPATLSNFLPIQLHLIGSFQDHTPVNVDDLISVVHMLWGAQADCIERWDGEEKNTFYKRELESVLKASFFRNEVKDVQRTFILNLPVSQEPRDFIEKTHIKELYGMLFCDEMWRDVHVEYAKEKLEKLHWSSKEFFVILYSPLSIIVLERHNYQKYVRIVVPRKTHLDFLKLHSASYPAIVRHGAFQYYEWMCFAEAMILVLEEEQEKLEAAINELLKTKGPIMSKLQNIVADYRKLESNVTRIRRHLAATVLSIPEMQTASREISKLKGIEETVTRAENQRILARDRLSAITQELWNTSESSRDWIVNLLVTVLSILSIIEVVDILFTGLGFEPSARAFYDVISGFVALAIVTTILLYHKHLREDNLRKRLQSYFKCEG